MAANALVQTRIDGKVKEEAAAVLSAMGLTVSEAVRLMLTRVAHDKALPFEPLIPNEQTVAAMREARAGGLQKFTSVDGLIANIAETAYEPDQLELLAAVGEGSLAWNVLETTVRLVMYRLGDGHNAIDVLTSGMNASPLASAFEVMINEFAPTSLKNHLLYAQKLFGRLRENRNEFTHGPMYVVRNGAGAASILTQGMTAKGRLKIYQGALSLADMRSFTAEVTAAQHFLGQLAVHLWSLPPEAKVAAIDKIELPSMPAKLVKRGNNLADI